MEPITGIWKRLLRLRSAHDARAPLAVFAQDPPALFESHTKRQVEIPTKCGYLSVVLLERVSPAFFPDRLRVRGVRCPPPLRVDPDQGDYFVIKVFKDPRFGLPFFYTKLGASSCHHEVNTAKRAEPSISKPQYMGTGYPIAADQTARPALLRSWG